MSGKATTVSGTSAKSATRAADGRLNRSYAIAALVSLIGLADALYLTVEHLTGASVRCTITTGCEEVLGSTYASVMGYPLAAIGALAYFIVFCLATLVAFGYRSLGNPLTAVVGLMLVTTLWLLYVQAFVLHAFCQYCLFSAVVTLLLSMIVAREAVLRK